MPTDWTAKVDQLIAGLPNGPETAYAEANREAIRRAVDGQGPDKTAKVEGQGIRAVFSIPSVHVPDFCRDGYKNGYDLGDLIAIGIGAARPPKTRELVDAALPVSNVKQLYFGAAALHGTGVRFYGDICLVLSPASTSSSTRVLDRNSYDLVRAPLNAQINSDQERKDKALDMSGHMSDLPEIAALMVFATYGARTRRLSSGQMSEAVLHDEDYIEVLREGSFAASDCEETRLSSGEAARVTAVQLASLSGPPPSLAEINYAAQRQKAVRALHDVQVKIVITTHEGRVR